jgi:glycerol dehydrogenase-like iron-containing ADH family enzyme
VEAWPPLVQIPTITSVDAGFTDAIGVRSEGRVRYVGTIVPEEVVLDIELIRSAPARLNRAGIGDVLSCHTGLHDWRAAVGAGEGVAWNDAGADLGLTLLAELDSMVADIHDGTRRTASVGSPTRTDASVRRVQRSDTAGSKRAPSTSGRTPTNTPPASTTCTVS